MKHNKRLIQKKNKQKQEFFYEIRFPSWDYYIESQLQFHPSLIDF